MTPLTTHRNLKTNRMFLAPNDYQKGWSNPAVTRAAIEAWESRNGICLPSTYRHLMIAFDGGSIYPNIFDSAILRAGRVPANDFEMNIERVYDFDYATQLWNTEVYGRGTPPMMMFIGDDPGGVEVLMSLRPQDFGVIYLWYHSTNEWGTDGNDDNSLIRQADSFDAFLNSLYDAPDRSGYDHWFIPIYAEPNVVRSFEVGEFQISDTEVDTSS